jgi:acyl-CoA thioester hydrolase
MRHLTKTHVRWDDLDAFGHVNNATYLTYAQEARSDFTWFKRIKAGESPILIEMVLAHASVDFVLPIYVGGFDLDVEMWVTKIGNSSFEMAYEMISQHGLHARARTVQVVISQEAKKPRPLTDGEREFLLQYFEPVVGPTVTV